MANNTKKREVEQSSYDSSSDSKEEDSWWMRRREASDVDDEDDKNSLERDVRTTTTTNNNKREIFGFDDELDGVEGAPEESGEEEEESSSYSDELEALEEEEEEEEVLILKEKCEEDEGQIRKEENAPVIPKVGAFYMHDDRFGRSRITSGRWKLHEVKDERKWQHDKFEEITLKESETKKINTYTQVRRISDGHNQGYNGNQGRGYDLKAKQFKPYDNYNYNNQSYSSRTIKGRGPVKYKPLNTSSYIVPLTRDKEFRKLPGMNSNTDSAITLSHASKVGCDSLACMTKKIHHHASSSYPGIYVPKKSDVKPRKTEGYLPGDDTRLPHSHAHLDGKIVTDSIGRDRLNARKSIHPAPQPHCTNLPFQSSPNRYTIEAPIDGPLPKLMSHLSLTSINHVDNFSPMGHQHVVQHAFPETTVCCTLQALNQQGSQSSFTAPSPSGSDLGVVESFASSRESEMAWSGRGNGTAQGYETSSEFGETYGHQNFTTTSPVMHTMQFMDRLAVGDLCELAVDSSVARYITQAQVGFGNSRLTSPLEDLKLGPCLPGKTIPPKAIFCKQPFSPDNSQHSDPNVTSSGGFYAFSLGQESSAGIPSNVTGAGMPGKPPDGTGVANNQYRHQRIKPQRYSKMTFKH